ncbi:hypothetical protein P8452_38054 [Trifolium repens]|nr:dessication-induced 1VOC superfamily protein [Trifolium repens]WJX51896.1 hypothetical protein P8452_38054 [Trifolium repens]
MASSSILNPAFAYTVLYVKDVAESVDFYAKAFGYSVRRLDESHRWGELESGHTTIAFTPIHQHETDDLTGVVHAANRSKQERPPLEVCFVYPDVDAAYKPEMKEWGQKVGYVRDIDGIVIRMGSHVKPTKLD